MNITQTREYKQRQLQNLKRHLRDNDDYITAFGVEETKAKIAKLERELKGDSQKIDFDKFVTYTP